MRLQVFGRSFYLGVATEMIVALWHQLSCFVVLFYGSTEVFFCNKSFLNNLSIPTLVLKKRNNSIFGQTVGEDQAAVVIRMGWITGRFNPEDFSTKKMMTGNTRHNLVESILSNIVSSIGGI